MKTIRSMHNRIPHSVVTTLCQVLTCCAFLFGSTAARGQQPPLPEAPQPTQSQSFESSIEQGTLQYELSDNRIWVIPDDRLTALTCSCFFKVLFTSFAQNDGGTTAASPQNPTAPPSNTQTPPSLQDLGISPQQAQGNAQDQARLDKRSHMLKVHQRLGLLAAIPLVATVIAGPGAGGKSTSSTDRYLHLALGSAAGDLYFTSAYFAIRAPKIPGTETRGPIRLHKALAWIHGPGMILTPILGAMAFDEKSRGEKVHGIASAHGAVAIVTAAAYGAAILSVSIKF
jgi:hypothetical protein